jgi:NAD+ synthase
VIGDLTFSLAQINPAVGDVAGNAKKICRHWSSCTNDLIIFPECVMSGYPADDLVLNHAFLRAIKKHFDILISESVNFSSGAVITLPWLENDKIYNAAFVVERGKILGKVLKHNLPNYGTFDDKRVFASGALPEPILFRGHKLGVIICEDTWFPEASTSVKKGGAEIIISSNASPFEMNKQPRRYKIVQDRVRETGLPLIYVNQVSGHDDLLYDGGSFVMNAKGDIIQQLPFFEEIVIRCHSEQREESQATKLDPSLIAQDDMKILYKALTFGLTEYTRKNGFKSIILGMSGGIDSALSAAIAVDALGAQNVRCVMMPSRFTSLESLEDAKECAELLGASYESISIEQPLTAFEKILPLTGLAHENIQSRIRGNILMAMSNTTGAMVLTTGNKSEMAVGYATLYGDMCGGYNVLKDVYKTEVFALSHWRNTQGRVIPERIITRPPSAELRANQTDQDSLPPYDLLDQILYGLIEDNLGVDELAAKGFDRDIVIKIFKLLDLAEYKRKQAAPGPKVSRKAFGRDRRYPICNGFRQNIEKE